LLEKLLEELEKVEVFRKKAIEFKGKTFPDLEGFNLIDGMPYHVVNGIPHYYYIVEEVSERLYRHHPRTLDECAIAVMAITDMDKVDVIGAMEAMAIPICTSLCLKARKPMAVIGKRRYIDDVSGYMPSTQIEIIKTTGYSKTFLFANDIPIGSNVLLVEPISSTGGTLRRVTESLEKNGINVIDMISITGKPDYKYENEVEKTGKQMKTLLKVYLKNYVELEDGHGYSETEVEKTKWFKIAEPIVDAVYPKYAVAAEKLLEEFSG
jgi:adenine/guanine phosphoribosyltransferase-like PRPP-binding protein